MQPSQEDIDALLALAASIEPLHADLVPYLQSWDRMEGAMMIHHPLVISLPHHEMQNKFINQMYIQKKAALEEARLAANWEKYVFLHERPYRIEALMDSIYDFGADDPDVVWPMIAAAWVDCENVNQRFDEWAELWDLDMGDRRKAMDATELKAYERLPEVITVYRGIGHVDATNGMSWTTNRRKAAWFARRFAGMENRRPHLVTGTIKKSNVVAHFLGRNEFEIVALPGDVDVVRVTTLRKKIRR